MRPMKRRMSLHGGSRFPDKAMRGAAVALALLLAACSSTPDNKQISLALPIAARGEQPTATQREHARILASYGGP